MNRRIYLSTPHLGGTEARYVTEALETNWVSSVGPNLDAFEREFEEVVGQPCVALSSGTAALHLALRLVGVGVGDEVVCPTLTFVASVNPVSYLGAQPVFMDSERSTWMMDPNLLERFLFKRAKAGRLPKAVVAVHLYGQCADMDPILESCKRYGVEVVEDAAEALGATYKGRPAGSMGAVSAFSFNGNKIITTSGGGLLSSSRKEWVEKARYWAQQARSPAVEYHHVEMGYNYRMSNVLAGIGRGQLKVLTDRVEQRRAVAKRYQSAFSDLPGLSLMPQAAYGLHTNWLSCFLVGGDGGHPSRDELIAALAEQAIEARPVWKPMHMQPLYAGCEVAGGEVAEDLYRRGICLPSSSSLLWEDQVRVIDVVRHCYGAPSGDGSGA